MKRLFCAVKVPATDKIKGVFEVFERTLSEDSSINWVTINNMHITLRFLGDTPVKLIDQIAEVLHQLASDSPPFSFHIKGCGTFGSIRQPRVIWLGIKNAAPLIALSEKVNTRLISLGYKPEKKLFNPHLTMGRIKQLNNPQLLDQLESTFGETSFGEFNTTSFHLIESFLRPSGPIYKVLHTFELGEGHRA